MSSTPPSVTGVIDRSPSVTTPRRDAVAIATVRHCVLLGRHPLRSQPVDNPVYNDDAALGTNRGTTTSREARTWGRTGTRASALVVVPRQRRSSSGVVHTRTGRRHAPRPATTPVVHSVHSPYDYNDRCRYGGITQSLHARPSCGRPVPDQPHASSRGQLAVTCGRSTLAALGQVPTPVRSPELPGCDKVRPAPTGVPSVRSWVVRGSMSRAYDGGSPPGGHRSASRTTPARPDRSDPT